MKHYLSLHLEAALHALKTLFKQPLGTLLLLLMLAVAMTLPLALYLGVQSSGAVLGRLNQAPQITLYLALDADAAATEAVRSRLADDARIDSFVFVSKQDGMAELQQSFQGQDLVSMLDSNPLPDVFTVTPKPGATPEEQTALQQDLAALPQVESAKMDAEWMQTLYQINRFVHQVFRFLAFTLGIAFVLVAHNTIRLQILSRKEEIEITKLLGAPSSFIRRPFLYQAAWQSLAAAAVSLALCAWLMNSSKPLVGQIFKPYGINIEWRFFYAWEVLLVLLVVTALGIAGAALATQQHLLSFKARKS